MTRLMIIVISAGMALSSVSIASAAPKRDLRGFTPGLTVAELTVRTKAIGCEFEQGCMIGEGTLWFQISKDLSPAVVLKVQYEFVSTLPREGMVQAVSKEFGAGTVETTAQVRANIRQAANGQPMTAPIIGAFIKYGGRIARWRLASNLELQLDEAPAKEGHTYRLFLSDPALKSADLRATIRGIMAREPKINEKPKF